MIIIPRITIRIPEKSHLQSETFLTHSFCVLRSFKSEARGCEEPKNRSCVPLYQQKNLPGFFLCPPLFTTCHQTSPLVVPASLVHQGIPDAHPFLLQCCNMTRSSLFLLFSISEALQGNVQKGTVNVWWAVSQLLARTVDVLSALSYYPDVIIILIILVFILIAAAVDRWDMSSLLWCVWQKSPQGSYKDTQKRTQLLRLSLIAVWRRKHHPQPLSLHYQAALEPEVGGCGSVPAPAFPPTFFSEALGLGFGTAPAPCFWAYLKIGLYLKKMTARDFGYVPVQFVKACEESI